MNKLIKNLDEIEGLDIGIAKRLAPILSDKVGIVNEVLERMELRGYGLYMYQCLSAKSKELFDISREVSSGGVGISNNREKALLACLGEALERYCMTYCNKADLRYAYWKKLPNSQKLSDFFFYSDDQYRKYGQFNNPKIDKIHWTKVKRYLDSRPTFYPASAIYLPFDLSSPVVENCSTGVAASDSLSGAILSGLLEVIERDALMINFARRLDPPHLDLSTINGVNKELILKIKKSYKILIFQLYSDIRIPIYVGLIWRKNKRGIHFGIGASASLNSDDAIQKTLKECLFTYFYSKNLMNLRQEDKNKIVALYEHFLYYQGESFAKLPFKNSKKIKYVKKEYSFDDLIKELVANKLDIHYKDLTTEDVKSVGIVVAKVVVPGMVDLNKSHLLPRMGAARLWDIPNKLSLKTSQKLSDLPHPFP